MKFSKALVTAAVLLSWNSFLSAQSENILGFETSEKGLTLQVTSGGCTNKEDFEIQLRESEPHGLVFKRTKEDLCEANFPFGEKFEWTWEELGISKGSRVLLQNRLVNRFNVTKEPGDKASSETPKAKPASENARKAILLGYTTNQDGIRIQVPSKGCTKKDSLSTSVSDFSIQGLSFHVETEDLCQVYEPFGTIIEWTWDELGVEGQVSIGNKVEKLIKVE